MTNPFGGGQWSVVTTPHPYSAIATLWIPQRGGVTIATGLSEKKARRMADEITALNTFSARTKQYEDFCSTRPVASDATPEEWDPTL